MDTQHAKMFVRSLSNSAAKILVAFLFARTALDVQELHEWTGMKRGTLYDGLKLLRSCGLLEPQTAEHGRQIWVPSGDLLPGIFQMSEKRTPEIEQMSGKGTPELQMSEKRTPTSLIGGGGGDSELIELNNPPTPPQAQMSEKRTPESERSALKFLQHTNLLFDGSFVNSKGLELCDPDTVLAWCAYAYDQARAGRADRPAGLVRRKLQDLEPAPQSLLDGYVDILPEGYLEAIGEIEYPCQFCSEIFGKRDGLTEHERSRHAYICEECHPWIAFETQEAWQAHYEANHDPCIPRQDVPVADRAVILDTPEGRAWQSVIEQLQNEMPRASFETWARDTQAVRFDGNVLTVGTRNTYAADWLTSRLTGTVERLLVGILNRSVKVVFTVDVRENEV